MGLVASMMNSCRDSGRDWLVEFERMGSRSTVKKLEDEDETGSAWTQDLVKPFRYEFDLVTGNLTGSGMQIGTKINYRIVGSKDILEGGIQCTLYQWMTTGSVKRVKVETYRDLGRIGSIILYTDIEKTCLQRILKKIVKMIRAVKDVTGTVLRPIWNSLGLDEAWNLSVLKLSNDLDNTDYVFPHYGWFDYKAKSCVLFNNAHLPQKTPFWLRRARGIDRQNIKNYVKLQMRYGDFVPRTCKTPLPITEQFNDGKSVNFTNSGEQAIDASKQALLVKASANKKSSFPTVNSISELYKAFDKPPSYSLDNKWQSDVWCGAAWLTGPFFGYFKPAAECENLLGDISKHVGSDHEYMNGSSFKDELTAGRLFVAEFSVFKGAGLENRPEYMKLLGGRYLCPDAVCVFRACAEKEVFEFLPIAIQLEKDGPVFLPSGDKWQWRIVKAHVMCNVSNVHQIGLHWSDCHAAAEPVCAAVLTELTKCHPLRQLMMPHIAFTLAINGFAWETLLAPPGDAPDGASIIQDNFALGPHSICLDNHTAKGWSKKIGAPIEPDNKGFAKCWWSTWKGYTHPREFKTRWGSTDQLKVFPPRDDGIAVGEVLESYVGEFIDLYYEDDEDVKEDVELQGFVKTAVTGLGKAPQEVLEQYWKAAESKQALKDLLTAFIFQVSCMHAARNFSQYDVYGTPHFAPANMRTPPPSSVGRSSEKEFLNAIPNIENSASIIGVMSQLSQYSGGDVYLARNHYRWITDSDAKDVQRKFVEKLNMLVAEMGHRNGNLERQGCEYLSYTLLMPNRVPTSVAI